MWFLFLLVSLIQTEEYEKAIIQTNKQRVLLQQIVKEYAFVIAGVYFKSNRQTFQESMISFEKVQNDLTNGNRDEHIPFAPTYELIKLFEQTTHQWRIFKTRFTSSDFSLILKNEKIIDDYLRKASLEYLKYTKDEEMTLSNTDENIVNSQKEWYLSEKLMKEIVLFMLGNENKAIAFATKNMFQESIQSILDIHDDSNPNYTIIEDIKNLWRAFDDDLMKVLKDNDKNKIYIMNLHKTQTLLLKRIERYKEVEQN